MLIPRSEAPLTGCGAEPREENFGIFGTRERSERGFFAPQARFFANSTTVFKDFDGFRLLCRALFGHTHEASHEWDTQEMMQHQHGGILKLIHVGKVRSTRSCCDAV